MTDKTQYKLIIADDHILLRDALANLINSFAEMKVIALAGNGKEVMELITNGARPHIALLDLNMPVTDGFETAKWLQENHPDINVLILTMYDSEIALIRLLQSGVKGFLKKDVHPDELRKALLSVAAGGYYYSHTTTGKLSNIFKGAKETGVLYKGVLTGPEIEFLKLAATEMTYKEIATNMGLNPRNVDGLRDGLFEKLDVKSRVGLVIYAVKNGIVRF